MSKTPSDFDRIPFSIQAIRSGNYWREELLAFADRALARGKSKNGK